uniref:CC chemokine SCYA107 n=1 Tax=Ictalurus punctatus TaxID=7998 RepID=Q20IL3_ICTPU|nr:CC chemokine SCYA107 [Ictalurus punctatus]
MPFSQKIRSLAVIAVLACIAITVATEIETVCCRQVITKEITVPITGFRVQRPQPPCVKAVIFYTSTGPVCSHWKEQWVLRKVTELRKLQSKVKKQT